MLSYEHGVNAAERLGILGVEVDVLEKTSLAPRIDWIDFRPDDEGQALVRHPLRHDECA